MKNIYLILLASFLSITLTGQNLPLSGLIYTPDGSGIRVSCMTPTFDSSYILLCETPGLQLVLVKVDESFNILWSKKYTVNTQMKFYTKIIGCHDSSLVLTGHNISSNTCIFKLNKDGDFIWAKSFSSHDAARTNVIETADNCLAVTCHGEDNGSSASTYIVKLTGQGAYLWGKKIGGYTSFIADAIANTSENHTLIAGNGANDDFRVYPMFFSLDADGQLLWSKMLVSPDTQTRIYSMTAKDSNVVLFGNRGIYCTSDLGNLKWAKNIYTNEIYVGYHLPPVIMSASDGNYFYPEYGYIGAYFGYINKVTSTGAAVYRKRLNMFVSGALEDFHHGLLIYGNGPFDPWVDYLGPQVGVCRVDSAGEGPSCVYSSGAGTGSSNSIFQTHYLNIVDYTPAFNALTGSSATIELLQSEQCVEALNVSEKVNITSLTIRPNPLIGQSIICVRGLSGMNNNLKVFDSSGKLVKTDVFRGQEYIFSRGSLNSGLYYLQINDDAGKQVTGKMVVD